MKNHEEQPDSGETGKRGLTRIGRGRSAAARPKMTAKEKLWMVVKIALLVVWVAAMLIVMEFLVGTIMTAILGPEEVQQPVWLGVYSVLAYGAAFLAIEFLTPALLNFWRSWRKTKTEKMTKNGPKKTITIANDRKGTHRWANRKELGLSGWPTWLDIVFGFLGWLVTILVAGGITTLLQNFPWFDASEEQDVLFSPFIDGADRVIAFIVLAVVAPIAEELIFRGWLYGKIRKILGEKMGKWGAITIAILVVSLLFAAVHGQLNVGVTVFVLSVVACILREMTGTVYAGMLVHIIQNSVAFYLLYVIGMV